ncbi:MAG: hypothetical protein QNJ45_03675 [Ardenticatenaceae bacterium]|nr:hypothetical protein [Ardenticatenaceae bacterium]
MSESTVFPIKQGAKRKIDLLSGNEPSVIAQIHTGAFIASGGRLSKAYYATWLGFDYTSFTAIEVIRRGSDNPSFDQDLKRDDGFFESRETFTDSYGIKTLETVRRCLLNQNEVDTLTQLLAELWASQEMFLEMVLDIFTDMIIFEGEAAKHFGGPGFITGPADHFHQQIKTYLIADNQ